MRSEASRFGGSHSTNKTKQTNYLPSLIGFTLEEIRSPFPECSSLYLFGSLLVFFSSEEEAEDAEEEPIWVLSFSGRGRSFLLHLTKPLLHMSFWGHSRIEVCL